MSAKFPRGGGGGYDHLADSLSTETKAQDATGQDYCDGKNFIASLVELLFFLSRAQGSHFLDLLMDLDLSSGLI